MTLDNEHSVAAETAPPGPEQPRGRLWLPALAALAALLPDPLAALPLRTYYFRDFTVTFLPLRLFAARELREGRLAAWNPYVDEGSFQLPVLYPPDLLHALWPSALGVSWLLTLHLPLAAVAAYWLARELGASRAGAFVAGAAYSLGGLALSCLNLYVFLQALALAPLVVGLLRASATRGGRLVAAAAVAVGLGLSTMAVEFVGQAVLLGLALAWAERPGRAGWTRVSVAVLLGIGLAALPVALTFGLLPETTRGAGFAPDVRLSHSMHPAVLLQALVPNLFGLLAAPAEAWWGGRFASRGFPYFLSLYLGPLAFALAFVGLRAIGRRARAALLVLAGVGLWYALGVPGGLAPAVAHLPLAAAFRFPSKALLLPHLAIALGAGFGVSELARGREAWRRLAAAAAFLGACVVGVAIAVSRARGLMEWAGVAPSFRPRVEAVVWNDALVASSVVAGALVASFFVRRARLAPPLAAALVSALLVADLTRAGSGLNPQTSPGFFDPLPEIAALRLADLDGGRAFSYGVDRSPALRLFLGRGGRRLGLATFYADRQVLGPYTNVIDRVEAPEARDLTQFSPRPRELAPEDYDPAAVGRLVPWLRNAAVTRILSLDVLVHPDLRLLASAPVGPPGLLVHVYGLAGSWPRAYVACRVVPAADEDSALRAPYGPLFDPARDVALVGGGAADCRDASVRRIAFGAGRERYRVETDGAAYLVARESFARGWGARVDGVPAPVLRANGKHRAVPLPPGRHDVELAYAPPGRRIGVVVSLLAAAATAAAALRRPRP